VLTEHAHDYPFAWFGMLVEAPRATDELIYARHAGLDEEVDRALLEHRGADGLLAVAAAPDLEDDGVDALPAEEVREHQAGRAGADDRDVGPHSASTSPTILKALCAAGAPQ